MPVGMLVEGDRFASTPASCLHLLEDTVFLCFHDHWLWHHLGIKWNFWQDTERSTSLNGKESIKLFSLNPNILRLWECTGAEKLFHVLSAGVTYQWLEFVFVTPLSCISVFILNRITMCSQCIFILFFKL